MRKEIKAYSHFRTGGTALLITIITGRMMQRTTNDRHSKTFILRESFSGHRSNDFDVDIGLSLSFDAEKFAEHSELIVGIRIVLKNGDSDGFAIVNDLAGANDKSFPIGDN
jgi:hypothetical protein